MTSMDVSGIYRMVRDRYEESAPEGLFDHASFKEALQKNIEACLSAPSEKLSAEESYIKNGTPVLIATKDYLNLLGGTPLVNLEITKSLCAKILQEVVGICETKNQRSNFIRDRFN